LTKRAPPATAGLFFLHRCLEKFVLILKKRVHTERDHPALSEHDLTAAIIGRKIISHIPPSQRTYES
jgi:hypothetical protein